MDDDDAITSAAAGDDDLSSVASNDGDFGSTSQTSQTYHGNLARSFTAGAPPRPAAPKTSKRRGRSSSSTSPATAWNLMALRIDDDDEESRELYRNVFGNVALKNYFHNVRDVLHEQERLRQFKLLSPCALKGLITDQFWANQIMVDSEATLLVLCRLWAMASDDNQRAFREDIIKSIPLGTVGRPYAFFLLDRLDYVGHLSQREREYIKFCSATIHGPDGCHARNFADVMQQQQQQQDDDDNNVWDEEALRADYRNCAFEWFLPQERLARLLLRSGSSSSNSAGDDVAERVTFCKPAAFLDYGGGDERGGQLDSNRVCARGFLCALELRRVKVGDGYGNNINIYGCCFGATFDLPWDVLGLRPWDGAEQDILVVPTGSVAINGSGSAVEFNNARCGRAVARTRQAVYLNKSLEKPDDWAAEDYSELVLDPKDDILPYVTEGPRGRGLYGTFHLEAM